MRVYGYWGHSLSVGIGWLFACVVSAAEPMSMHVQSWVSTEDMAMELSEQPPLAFGAMPPEDQADIQIDASVEYQTMLGLGASLEHSTCYNLSRLDPEKRAELVTRLVSPDAGIGMNIMRVCIGTPDFTGEPWYSYDDMPPGEKDETLEHFTIEKDRNYVLPVLKLVHEKNPDLLFFASPWSPPGWMKTCDDLIGGHLYPKHYDAYARYFVRFVRAYEAEGIPLYAVTVQNEPGVNKRDDVKSWWYPSCQWSLVVDEDTWWPVPLEIMGHAERDFIRDYLGPAFQRAGVKTRIWCYDHNFNNLWYPRAILSDKEAARYVDGTAFHPYVGEASEMGAFHDEFPDKPVYLSEGSTYGSQGAVEIIDFLRNWACTYNAWVTVIDSRGKPNNGPFEATETCVTIDADTREVTYHFDYFMYGQFMKFIKRGAVRIDSGSCKPGLAHVAFKNPDGHLVLVVANSESEPRPFSLAWNGRMMKARVPAKSVATYEWTP